MYTYFNGTRQTEEIFGKIFLVHDVQDTGHRRDNNHQQNSHGPDYKSHPIHTGKIFQLM